MRLVIALALVAVTAAALVQGLVGHAPYTAMFTWVVVAGALGYCLLLLQAQHRSQSALLHAVLRRFPFPVVVTDPAGRVRMANQGALDLMGRVDAELSTPDGRRLDLGTLARTGESGEVRLTRPDGTTSDISIEVVPIEGGVGTVFALQDLGAQRAFEESLHHAAYHDTLTGLPNRAMLWQHLNAAAAGEDPYAVLLIDLDDFRKVNDVHGHRTGDELLTGAAHRLRDAAYAATRRAPQRAVVARLGGDEFAVLLPGGDARAANRLAALLRAAFDQPFPTGVGRLTLRGTVEVLTDAETALDRARAA